MAFSNFSNGAPCPNFPTVTFGEKTYNTVQIGNQCWFKENLNLGTRINGIQEQTNNQIIEKYCYNDLESNCDISGGLYQWGEIVQYLNGGSNTTSWNPAPTGNVQGICPSGWHLPSDAEWCTLTQYIDPTVNCNANGPSGIDAALKMKSTSGWTNNGNGTNSSGFTIIPTGGRRNEGIFYWPTDYSSFLTATQYDANNMFYRDVNSGPMITRGEYLKIFGRTVRCIKD